MTSHTATEFNRLIEYLKLARGFDFSGYKVSSLMRRIQKRMREAGVENYTDYIDYLEVHPDEFGPLFDTILINVTEFFRDPPAWEYLGQYVVPRVLESKSPDRPVRLWSAGCASGEEAYSLAIVLNEAMGEEDFRRRVKIYATDADDEELTTARHGSYDGKALANVPPEQAEKYFESANGSGRKTFRADLRRCLIFGRHNLIQDAAISRIDLLVCRNTLMYFNSETQDRILARFHFALNPTGYLFLGKAETLLSHNNSFRPVDLRNRIFVRTPSSNMRERLLAISGGPSGIELPVSSRHSRVRDAALDNSPAAQLVIDRRGFLVHANDRARRSFNLQASDLGRLLQDLEVSYRPVELRSHIEEAYKAHGPVQIPKVEWRPAGEEARYVEVQICPLSDGKSGAILGISIAFIDLTRSHQLQVELERANQELETAYEELQSANEELETTNEELQSTIEELETTNEELQSANEELETMNEELQSTNEELRAINEQTLVRSDELNRINSYFESVLTGLKAAVTVLDRDLKVQVWSQKARDLWGLLPDEARGQPFLELDIGIPVASLDGSLQDCLEGRDDHWETALDGYNRRGKPVRCTVTCTPLRSPTGIDGVILLMEEVAGG